MIWKADAPSNIALIKYMGKSDSNLNISANPSLSYTLKDLRTFVEIHETREECDRWVCLEGAGLDPNFSLSEKGKIKFLNHLRRIKNRFEFRGTFEIRSNNSFPSDCGLASSASSFAALTLCAVRALQSLTGLTLSENEIVELSRMGSGSSCRSFFSPWSIWDEAGARAAEVGVSRLSHMVVVVDDRVKSVSSSEAHTRVASSLLFGNRAERARQRLPRLMKALQSSDWTQAHEIIWAEFWDMHALFETADPAFGYMSPDSLHVLRCVRDLWNDEKDGPLVTMDAGPNVHLLFREDQMSLRRELQTRLKGTFQIWESQA